MWGVPSSAERSASAAAMAEALKRARYLVAYTIREGDIVHSGTTVIRDPNKFASSLNKVYREATYVHFEVRSIHYEDNYDNCDDPDDLLQIP